MAEQSLHDVVDQTQSAGGHSPVDVSATKSTDPAARADNDETTAFPEPDEVPTNPGSALNHTFLDRDNGSDPVGIALGNGNVKKS